MHVCELLRHRREKMPGKRDKSTAYALTKIKKNPAVEGESLKAALFHGRCFRFQQLSAIYASFVLHISQGAYGIVPVEAGRGRHMYIELFLLDNFVMDCLMLRIAAALCARRLPIRRMAIASALGACCAWASLFFPPLLSLPGKIVCGLLFALAFPAKRLREYTCAVAAVFAAAFLTGGFAFCLALCFGGGMGTGVLLAALPVRTALVIALAATFVPNLVRRLQARRAQAGFRAEVIMHAAGREYRLDALIDTGNGLVEPLSGKPVAVAYLPELAEHAHIPIPTATAHGTDVLYALKPERLCINGRESDALLALCPTPIRGAEALLPPVLAEQMNLGG